MTGPNHFRFILRTAFVLVTVFCLMSAYVGYEYKLIKERRAYLKEHRVTSQGMVKTFPEGFHRGYRGEPLLLWLFGEPALMELGLWIDMEDVVEWPEPRKGLIARDNPALVRARKLFPEASISPFCKVGSLGISLSVKP